MFGVILKEYHKMVIFRDNWFQGEFNFIAKTLYNLYSNQTTVYVHSEQFKITLDSLLITKASLEKHIDRLY